MNKKYLLKYLYNPPLLIKKIYSNCLWETSNNKILLTLDDGPNPGTTELILKKLNEHNIKALFFCIGKNVQSSPELSNQILSEGHTIGNHTFNHKRITNINSIEFKDEIDSFNSLLKEKFNHEVKYFRPPYGRFNYSTNKIIKNRNLKNIMWSLLTYDYKNDFNIVKFSIKKHLKNNSIIVLHDSMKTKDIILDSISLIIDEAAAKDFEIGEPDGCLK